MLNHGLLTPVIAVISLLILAGAANASEGECPDQNPCATETATPPVAPSPTIRDSIENGKNKLADNLFGLQLSAFGDVVNSYDDNGNHILDGTVELDASADFGYDLQGAVAFVNESEGASMPVSFLDFHTFGGRIAPRGKLWVEKGLHLEVGRFDVPFGNDWQYFASKDSVSISRPLTTGLVMGGGYNDRGMRVLGNNGSVNFNAFLLHGFNTGRLVGGRLAVTPLSDPFSLKGTNDPKPLECGFSYFYDSDASWNKNETGMAADVELHMNDWIGRFEYMIRNKEPSAGIDSSVMSGWHVTQEYALGDTVAWPTTIFARYEQVAASPPEIATLGNDAGDARDVRVAAGTRTNLGGSDVVLFKFEIQHYLEATPATRATPGFVNQLIWNIQLVVAL